MQLQPRDLAVLLDISQFKFVTREHVQRLEFSPSTASVCKRRLTLLFHHGYVGRIPLPIRNAYGAARAIYYLERRGRQALVEAGLSAPVRPFRRSELPGEFFLHHRIDVSDVRVSFTLSARLHGLSFAWWDEEALRQSNMFMSALNHEAGGLIPDGYFTLGGGRATDGFAVEVDRATVSENRMRRRFLAYGRFSTSEGSSGRLPCESFRVLTIVTRSEKQTRLERLKRACESIGGGSLFWFANYTPDLPDLIDASLWQVAGQEGLHPLALSMR